MKESIATFSSLGHMGELGNQLFQVAAVSGYATAWGKTAIFPRWTCKISGSDYTNIFKNPVNQILTASMSNEAVRMYYMELKYCKFPNLKGNIDFAGYFQSEKYFENIDVKKMFEPTDEIRNYIENKYSNIISYENKVSLHVRTAKRSANDSDVHASATREFIEEALKDFADKDLIVVFADNMTEANKILPSGKPYFRVENEKNYIDLFLMGYFDSYIVSPSTFGWWGAYLSKSEKPRVTVMKDWFAKDKAKAYLNDNDIIPTTKGWHAI